MSTKRTTLEIIAPTIEEAIDEGLTKLGLTEDEVEVEILDEGTKGIFGLGSRQARIRLTVVEETTPAMVITEPVEDETVAGTDILEPEKSDATDHILEIARETVTDLLGMMKIQAEVKVYYGVPDEGDRNKPIHVDIQGQDLSILIGRKAETLNALQYIARLIMGKELEQSIPLVIDVEGYRRRRDRQIRQLARRVADQVRTTGRSQALEPMVPAERRLVHIELRNDPDLFTKSIGEGNRRKVVIHVKN